MSNNKTEVKFFTDKGNFSIVSLEKNPLLKAFNSFKESTDKHTNKLNFKDAKIEKVVVKKYPYTITLSYNKFLKTIKENQ